MKNKILLCLLFTVLIFISCSKYSDKEQNLIYKGIDIYSYRNKKIGELLNALKIYDYHIDHFRDIGNIRGWYFYNYKKDNTFCILIIVDTFKYIPNDWEEFHKLSYDSIGLKNRLLQEKISAAFIHEESNPTRKSYIGGFQGNILYIHNKSTLNLTKIKKD